MSGHERIYELISLKLDGVLDAAGERELDEHLASCDECREVYGLLRGVRLTLDVEPEPPETLLSAVMEGVERINKVGRKIKARRTGITVSLLAAAAAVALVVFPLAADENGDSAADDGIAAYGLENAAEARGDASPVGDDQGQTVSLFPGSFSLPTGIDVKDSVENLCGEYYAVAYFEEIPEEIMEAAAEYIFSDGSVGYDTTRELFEKYESQAVRIDYPDPDGERIMAVSPPVSGIE